MLRFALATLATAALALPAAAQDAASNAKAAEAARAEIGATMGSVPDFIAKIPDSVLPGIWDETKRLEFSGDTALDTKTKALISLAVSSQIPCQYCIWMDARAAHDAGATDEQIGEAISVAGLTRNWSTIFNGLQVDFAAFKASLGG